MKEYAARTLEWLSVVNLSHCLLFFVLTLGVAVLVYLPALKRRGSLPARVGWIVLALASIGAMVPSTVSYLGSAGLSEHMESQVVAVSWLWARGEPIYPPLDDKSRYEMLYGPALYLMNGTVLRLFGPSIGTAKVFAAFCAWTSLLLFFLAAKRRASWAVALTGTGYCALGQMVSTLGIPVCLIVRSDTLLLLFATLGLLCSQSSNRWLAAIGTGLALGVCGNLKIHGVLYLLLPFTLLYARWGWRICLLAGFVGSGPLLLPFLVVPGVSLENYIGLLRTAGKHGLSRSHAVHILRRLLFLGTPLLPPLLLACWRPRGDQDSNRGEVLSLAAACAVATLLIGIPASKDGSGPHHLIPLIPSYGYLLVVCLADWARRRESPRVLSILSLASLSAFAMTVSLAQLAPACRLVENGGRPDRDVYRSVESDLEGLSARFRDRRVCMGFAGDESYNLTLSRPILVFRGNPYLIDPPALMDMQKGGIEIPEATIRSLRDGDVQVWLLPKAGEPFSLANWYDSERKTRLFGEEFRKTFLEYHQKQGESTYFDIWYHRSLIDKQPPDA